MAKVLRFTLTVEVEGNDTSAALAAVMIRHWLGAADGDAVEVLLDYLVQAVEFTPADVPPPDDWFFASAKIEVDGTFSPRSIYSSNEN